MNIHKQKVSVVIPFYNKVNDLKACVASLQKANYDFHHIFVVDNSTQSFDTAHLLAAYSNIKVIKAKPRIGFGRACNLGLYASIEAGDDYAVILNQDAVVKPDFANELLKPFAKDKDIVVSFPMIMGYDFSNISSMFVSYYLSPMPEFIYDASQQNIQEYYISPSRGSGACLMFDLSQMSAIHFFDPNFFMYCEDLELLERIVQEGKKIAFVPSACIGHRHSNVNAEGKAAEEIDVWKHQSYLQLAFKREQSLGGNLLLFSKLSILQNMKALGRLQLSTLFQSWMAQLKVLSMIGRISQSRRLDVLAKSIEQHLREDKQ